jgi:hypothetical protein
MRVAEDRMMPQDLAILDAIAYGVAKLFNTPIDQLVAEAAEHRAARARVGASATEQLHHLDQLVALHETFWAGVAQEHPTPKMRAFMRHHWDPWVAAWWEARPHFDAPSSSGIVASAVHEAARSLSSLRELAAYNGIPTPDLGTSQHGFVQPGEPPMVSGDHQNIQAPRAGADPIEGYRAVAIDAVRSAHHQAPAISVFGYARTGHHQKVYLFHDADQANAWHAQLQPGYDYAAVFSAADHQYAPVVEDFGGAVVSGDAQVGHWLVPLALGVPAGALGGYYYRKWQEKHPGKIIPWISGATNEAHHAVDHLRYAHPVDSDVARRSAWPRTKILIHSAIADVRGEQQANPAVAYVWFLEPWGPNIATFSSYDQALAFVREAIDDYAAIALFDATSPHWPNPVSWHKSDAPEHETAIAQQIARHAVHPVAASAGAPWVGAGPWVDIDFGDHEIRMGPWVEIVGAAIDVFRKQAQAAAEVAPGPVVGLRRDARDQWQIEQFRSSDDADDWFGHATHDPAHFTYAAYFDKRDPTFPEPLNEAIGGARASSTPGSTIHRGVAEVSGARIRPDYRARAVAAARTKQREAPAPFYVYLRSPYYEVTWSFATLEEANAYGAREVENPRGSIDYLALFAATDHRWPHPVYEWSDRAAEISGDLAA